MFRNLSAAVLVVGLAWVAAALPTPATAQTLKAYAPEDLRQLSISDRRRVIEREYSDQSNGRRIPNDQLQFYLDQVNSGWNFSRIKQDIATSLRGQSGGWPDNGWNDNSNGNTQTVRCESISNRERTCGTPFRGRIVLARQLSKGACVEGQSWIQRGSSVSVRNGCRGEFAEASGSGGNWGGGWGGQSGYSVTCNSDKNRRRTCAWDRQQGRPVVIENISKTRCQEGQNWGWDGNAIWVDRGCRARFGAR